MMTVDGGAQGSRGSLTEAQEDYLKAVFVLGGDERAAVATRHLADRLGVQPASVTGMVRRLAQLGLVTHRPYRGVRLTDAGYRVALEIVRHHRLLETYLARALGYSWEEVHDEAERLEHVISERFEERIAGMLGNPTHDPHGDPIPGPDLSMPSTIAARPLSEAGAGCGGPLVRVASQDSDTLAMLSRLGLELGVRVEVVERTGGSIRVRLGDTRYLLPAELAGVLWIGLREGS